MNYMCKQTVVWRTAPRKAEERQRLGSGKKERDLAVPCSICDRAKNHRDTTHAATPFLHSSLHKMSKGRIMGINHRGKADRPHRELGQGA